MVDSTDFNVIVGDFNSPSFSAGCQHLELGKMIAARKLGMDDISRIEKSLGDVRGEMKELREAITGLVRVDEKVANLIKLSEKNSTAINDLSTQIWKRLAILNAEISNIKEAQAAENAVGEMYGKILWPMLGGVVSIIAAVIASAFLS